MQRAVSLGCWIEVGSMATSRKGLTKYKVGSPISAHAGEVASGKVVVEIPATLSEARKMLAASYRRAGFSGRQAALKVAEVVSKVRSKGVAA